MNLTPTEIERLVVFNAAEMARRNLREGIRLSHPEAVALLADEVMLAARRNMAYDEVIDHAASLLHGRAVRAGCARHGAHRGAGRSVPGRHQAGDPDRPDHRRGRTISAQARSSSATIRSSCSRAPSGPSLTVVNRGDRDIQVRSQSHFFETNPALEFDRRAAWGHKLDVASGAGVRFEPGIPVEVMLVPMAGDRVAQGFSGLVNGPLDADGALDAALAAQNEG